MAIVEDMLPPATFHILLALADEDRHGYAIIQDVAARTDGELSSAPARSIARSSACSSRGSSSRPRERPAPDDDDERRRYYRITPSTEPRSPGPKRAGCQLVRMARARGLRPGA